MGFTELDAAGRDLVANWSVEIASGKKTVLEFIESLKSELCNVDLVENALTKLVQVLQKLPNDCLNENEVGTLLEFLLGRLEASALRTGCVITGIHHLVTKSVHLPENCEVPIFQCIYNESTVQCFCQSDRGMLFDLLDFLLMHRLQGLKTLSQEFVLCFMRAVNGERDPRCLLQVFRLYLIVVKNFDLGFYAEDFFEIAAVYYPLEYTPAEEENQVTRESLLIGLESCLLSHHSFSFYCFQLISEKLLDEETGDETRVEIFAFLQKAVEVFPRQTMQTFLDDYLTVFRRVALNPANKSTSHEIASELESVFRSILNAFNDKDDVVKSIAHTMMENCEPFVLQAEMGLTGKALSLLAVMAESNKMAADIVLPQIIYWLSNLINADTINAPQNKREIITEAIEFLPGWFQLALNQGCIAVASSSLPGFLESLKQVEEQFGSVVHPVEYKIAEIILSHFEELSAKSDEASELVERLVWRSLTDLKVPNEKLRSAICSFISAFVQTNFNRFASLIEKEAAERPMDSTMTEIFALGIVDTTSLDRFGHVVVQALRQQLDIAVINGVVDIFERNKRKPEVVEVAAGRIIEALVARCDDATIEEAILAGQLLQDIFLRLDQSKVDELSESLVGSWKPGDEKYANLTVLPILQTQKADLLEKAYCLLTDYEQTPSVSVLIKYLYLALCIRLPSSPCVRKEEYHAAISLLMMSTKADFLLARNDCLSKLDDIFLSFANSSPASDWRLTELIDFESRGFNPLKNRYSVGILWRQRILCQFIPLYVKYFSKTPENDKEHRSVLLSLLSPILTSASNLSVPLTNELMLIFPILTEAMRQLTDPSDADTLLLVLTGFVELLRQADFGSIDKVLLGDAMHSCQRIVVGKWKISVTLKVLDALELIAKKGSSEHLLPAYSNTIAALCSLTSSTKRVVRQRGAAIRNLWETVV